MDDKFKRELQNIVDELEPRFRVQGEEDIELITKFGVNSYDELLAILSKNEDTNISVVACWIISRLGDEKAIPILISALKYEDFQLRSASARALGELNVKESVENLISTLIIEKDNEVSEAIVYALGLLGDKSAFDVLVSILKNRSREPKIRGLVAEALADLKDRRAVVPLIEVLNDVSVEVRFWAIFSLGELGDEQALPELQKLVSTDTGVLSDWGSIKEEAFAAIHRIKEQNLHRQVNEIDHV